MTTTPSRRAVITDPHLHDDERPAPDLRDGAPSSVQPTDELVANEAVEEAPLEDEPLEMSAEEFEIAVGDALDQVPVGLMDQLDNVVFLVEDEPPPDDPDLLGVYDGIPLTERDLAWGGQLPDRITIFRGPLLRMCHDRDELLDEIAITVVHEIAHHFGIDDETLHELGWG